MHNISVNTWSLNREDLLHVLSAIYPGYNFSISILCELDQYYRIESATQIICLNSNCRGGTEQWKTERMQLKINAARFATGNS